MASPPRVAVWLLTRCLPPEDRDDIIGDLDEDFEDRRTTVGDAAARRWYLRQALRLAWAVTPRKSQPDHLFPERRSPDADSLWRDLRVAVRRLSRQPLTTVLSVATLAGSIGAVTATWSLVDATLLHPIPAWQPDRLVAVGFISLSGSTAGRPASLSLRWNTARRLVASDVFADSAMYGTWDVQRSDDGGDTRLSLGISSSGLFQLLGVPVAMGRDFTPDDDRPGAPLVVIVSHRFWHVALRGDPNVVGRPLELNGYPVTVVGVAARGFAGLDLSIPPDVVATVSTAGLLTRGVGPSVETLPVAWRVAGRLRDREETTVTEARLTAALAGLRDQRPALMPLETAALAAPSRLAMQHFEQLLALAVGLLLLIGCLTVGLLVLLRTERRRSEFAVCLALGASRWRLARSVVLEGALLAGVGALVSLPAAETFLGALGALQVPGGFTLDDVSPSLGPQAFGAAAAAAFLATMVIALIAGALGFRQPVADVLHARSGSTPRLARRKTRSTLIAGQAAVTLVLVSGAALFARSLEAAVHVNPGFETAHLITGDVALGAYRFTPALAPPVFEKLYERLTHNPSIRAVSMPLRPGGMSADGVLRVDGIDRQFPSFVGECLVDEHYFATIGLPILAGRDFTARDDARAPLVIVVSDSFGRLIADGGSAVGHRVQSYHGRPDGAFPMMTVIGIVPDVITSLSDLRPLVMYLPVGQDFGRPLWSRALMVRPAADIKRAEEEIVATVRQIDPAPRPAPQVEVRTMDEQMTQQMGPQRLGATVLGTLGGIALLLTVLGTYVLAESMAVARQREMGIRAALGARALSLGAIVLGETGRLVGAGLLAGLFMVWAEAATIRAFLLRTEPLDPVSLAGTAALILAITAVVSLRPAIAASRIDIVRVLRDE